MGIAWDQFSWEAFATLATGIAAVLGAVKVAQRQTIIMESQARIALFEQRAILFDRRFEIYSVLRSLMIAIMNAPLEGVDHEVDYEQATEAVLKAKFIFSPNVADQVETVFKRAHQAHYSYIRLKSLPNRSAEDHANAFEPLSKLADDLQALTGMMSEEMHLSEAALPNLPR